MTVLQMLLMLLNIPNTIELSDYKTAVELPSGRAVPRIKNRPLPLHSIHRTDFIVINMHVCLCVCVSVYIHECIQFVCAVCETIQ